MSRKEEIRKKLKKEQKKELEKLGLNRENEKYIVSLKNEDDDLKVENGKVFTIEGNSKDEVKEKSYNLSSKSIYGYGV